MRKILIIKKKDRRLEPMIIMEDDQNKKGNS